MNRSILLGLAILSSLAIVASASAQDKNRNRENRGNHQGRGNRVANVLGIIDAIKKHKAENRPVAPVEPTTDTPQPPQSQPQPPQTQPQPPQGRPGFVWVDGHWERIKSNQGSGSGANTNTAPDLEQHQGLEQGKATSRSQGVARSSGYGYHYNTGPPPVAPNPNVTVTDPNQKPRDRTIRGGMWTADFQVPKANNTGIKYPRDHRPINPPPVAPAGGNNSVSITPGAQTRPITGEGYPFFVHGNPRTWGLMTDHRTPKQPNGRR